MSDYSIPFDQMVKHPSNERRTPLVYRGGKTSLAASWIIPHFPPHRIFVDVFGGGGGITFAKGPSEVDVYNDIGNVAKFFKVLRKYGDDVYKGLYFTPFSREYFYNACETLEFFDYDMFDSLTDGQVIEWAILWYVSLSQSFRHEEDDSSWLVSKGVNSAKVYASHVDDFPIVIDRMRNVIVENGDFKSIINTYDSEGTLFYCDPPYVPDTWEADKGGYRNIMPVDEHVKLLDMLNNVKGQVVLSGYPSHLYESRTQGWKRVEKTRLGGIKNSSQEASTRTEVLWIREHNNGLWGSAGSEGSEISQTDASRLYTKKSDAEAIRIFRERNNIR